MCHIAVFVAVPSVGMTLTFEENEHVSVWKFRKSIIIVFLTFSTRMKMVVKSHLEWQQYPSMNL